MHLYVFLSNARFGIAGTLEEFTNALGKCILVNPLQKPTIKLKKKKKERKTHNIPIQKQTLEKGKRFPSRERIICKYRVGTTRIMAKDRTHTEQRLLFSTGPVRVN